MPTCSVVVVRRPRKPFNGASNNGGNGTGSCDIVVHRPCESCTRAGNDRSNDASTVRTSTLQIRIMINTGVSISISVSININIKISVSVGVSVSMSVSISISSSRSSSSR